MVFCSKCGTKLNGDSRFCNSCGAPVVDTASPRQPGSGEEGKVAPKPSSSSSSSSAPAPPPKKGKKGQEAPVPFPSPAVDGQFVPILDDLKRLYKSKILPLEQAFKFDEFHSPCLTDTDFDAKPMVLLIGQYSTGKTTFIKYLLERDFPGAHIGPEPTTGK
jgi:EH domain-containing protein 1